eukprot:scaffold67690_cov55-Cyclotella_meneghiniana.AAC.5
MSVHENEMRSLKVEALVNELNNQVGALDEVLSVAKLTDIATPEQLDAIKCISSTAHSLADCLGLDLFTDSLDSHEVDTKSRARLRNNMAELSSRSAKNLRHEANSDSTRKLLDAVLKPGKSRRGRRGEDNTPEDQFCMTKLPKALIRKMVNSKRSDRMRASAAHIAQIYGGINLPEDFDREANETKTRLKSFAGTVMRGSMFVRALVKETSFSQELGIGVINYLPTEFQRLDLDKKKQLARMLSLENLKMWGFNTFEIENITHQDRFVGVGGLDESDTLEVVKRGCPIVMVGWAVLASPYAQLAMATHVNDLELIEQVKSVIRQKAHDKDFGVADMVCDEFSWDVLDKASDDNVVDCPDGYYFLDLFGITPKAICHFLRKVEKDYPSREVNPYHNNIHAADVIQTTHALLQIGGADLLNLYSPLEVFTILIAAALHDVQHPGTNNNYHVTKQTEVAELYNDRSVLENMHATRASQLLKESGGDHKDVKDSIYGGMKKNLRVQVRTGVISSILSTDMSYHFKSSAKMEQHIGVVLDEINSELMELPGSSPAPLLSRLNKSEHSKLREKLLPFILHNADISNPAKPPIVSNEWKDCCYDEFFLQGDKEAEEGTPISPLCDRSTTNTAEGQKCLPKVDSVLKQLDENLDHWTKVATSEVNSDDNEDI